MEHLVIIGAGVAGVNAATKLVACEVLRSDDATVLITESDSQISVKEKYDILRKEAMEILDGKKEGVFLIEWCD